MRDTYPFGMLAVPLQETVRIHASSGTRGKPTVVGYTRYDIEVFAEVNARAIACAGGQPDDVLHVAYGYGLFTGGLGLHYGGERLGATVVPASGGNAGFQVQMLSDLGAAGLACTPSFALQLAERAAADGLIDQIPLRYGVFGAEPWSEAFREKLEAAWGGIDACDIYGLSEVIGPGVAMECREGKGALHIFDDHFFPEVVDPETGDPVAPGKTGELVLTTLTKEALPVLRYRTGDITQFVDEECPCGRTHRRIARFSGRVDDMLVIRGVNVFPSEIEAVLLDDRCPCWSVRHRDRPAGEPAGARGSCRVRVARSRPDEGGGGRPDRLAAGGKAPTPDQGRRGRARLDPPSGDRQGQASVRANRRRGSLPRRRGVGRSGRQTSRGSRNHRSSRMTRSHSKESTRSILPSATPSRPRISTLPLSG